LQQDAQAPVLRELALQQKQAFAAMAVGAAGFGTQKLARGCHGKEQARAQQERVEQRQRKGTGRRRHGRFQSSRFGRLLLSLPFFGHGPFARPGFFVGCVAAVLAHSFGRIDVYRTRVRLFSVTPAAGK